MKSDLYEERLYIIENSYLNNYSKREKLQKVELKKLQKDSFELFINLKIIKQNRYILKNKKLNKEEKDFLILKIIDSTNICENLLKLEEDTLLNENEIFIKKWLKIKLLFNSLKEKLLLCGCKL
tara:strand:+ start:2017 stop:2388 length:372 start_codon:yes stop_codon:yes gene_type:complete